MRSNMLVLGEAEPLGKFKTKEPSGEIFTSLKYGTIQFVTGAVTGVNITRASHGEQMIIVDDTSEELWLKNYCTANPTESLIDAIMDFVKEMANKMRR